MHERGFSALPVVQNRPVIGVSACRSVAPGLPAVTEVERNLMSLPVDTFVERYYLSSITDEMSQLFKESNLREAICVGRLTLNDGRRL